MLAQGVKNPPEAVLAIRRKLPEQYNPLSMTH
jgi:hypothetical protein